MIFLVTTQRQDSTKTFWVDWAYVTNVIMQTKGVSIIVFFFALKISNCYKVSFKLCIMQTAHTLNVIFNLSSRAKNVPKSVPI